MKILYVCSFSMSQGSGKSRATQQKIEALRRNVDTLVVLSPFEAFTVLGKVIHMCGLEVRVIWCLLRNESGFDVFISRGYAGIFSMFIARLRSIRIVREVHANALEEADILGKNFLSRFMLRSAAWLSYRLDRTADLRIFNNPSLLECYQEHGGGNDNDNDIYVYNGCDPSARSYASREEVLERMNLPLDKKLLAFIGSASKWHGVDYLVNLQLGFDENNENVQIVCGGGVVAREIDPQKRLLNIAPLNAAGCADLIRAVDGCLLPVKNIRVSPGSPLKLYDYILNGGFVIAQASTPGYSDEIEKYGVGITVDFTKIDQARSDIMKALSVTKTCENYDSESIRALITWDARMMDWIRAIDQLPRHKEA